MYSPGEGLGSTFFFEIPVVDNKSSLFSSKEQLAAINSPVKVAGSSLPGIRSESDEWKSSEHYIHFSNQIFPASSDSKRVVSAASRKTRKSNTRTPCKSVEVDNDFIAAVPLSGPVPILLVDDASSNRKMVRRMLDKSLFIPDEAEDGLVAVSKVRQMVERGEAPYDVILMDFMMPKMDGPTATRAIRRLGYTGIIIGVTGNSSPQDLETFTTSGADLVIPKPLDIDLLVANIRRK